MTQQWTPSDLASWEMTKKSIKQDGDIGAKFLVFLNFWLNTAEKMMSEPPPTTEYPDGLGATMKLATALPPSPANAVRKALEVAEQRLGFIDVHFMGQLLLVIGLHWQHGDALCREMSAIELKITGEALRIKIDDMALQAEADDGGFDVSGGDEGDQGLGKESLQQSIDPLDEPDRRDDSGPGIPGPRAGAGGFAGHLRAAESGAHGQAVKRAQVRRREARQRSADAARQDQGGEGTDGVGGEG